MSVGVLAVLVTLSAATLVCAQTSSYVAALQGSQEVPPSGSAGTGSGTFTLNESTGLFSWNITFSGTTGSETAAHVHGPANPGSNAGVQFALSTGSPKVGSTVLTGGQMTDLKAGLYYVNVHTNTSPGGEIRGQILPVTAKVPATSGLSLIAMVLGIVAVAAFMRRRLFV